MTVISSDLRWLLDRACEAPAIVRLLLPQSVDQVSQWNACFPNWSDSEMLNALAALSELKMIAFFRATGVGDSDDSFVPIDTPSLNVTELINDYRHRKFLEYRLTPLGSATWESAARPDWSRYYIVARHYGAVTPMGLCPGRDASLCEATALTEDRARIALFKTALDYNLLSIPGTEYYTVVKSWKVTYWKVLESGFKGAMLAVEGGDERPLSRCFLDAELESDRGFDQFFGSWYAKSRDDAWNEP